MFRLLSQSVNDEVCKAIKILIDAQAKTRKLVWNAIATVYYSKNLFISIK